MRLAEQWRTIQARLPENWAEAGMLLIVEKEGDAERAAALLGPANPGRRGKQIRFFAARGGAGLAPDAIRRLLARLDTEGIRGQLELVTTAEAAPEETTTRLSLAQAWQRELEALPADWSDLYCEIRLDSTDYLDRGALLMAPLNPGRYGPETGFRFRCARLFGYGASPEMVRRCLERLDAEGITGGVRVLRSLSDSRPVATQGPVWYVEGKPV